jgi:hypothetical protein
VGWVQIQPVGVKMNLNHHPSGLKPVSNLKSKSKPKTVIPR